MCYHGIMRSPPVYPPSFQLTSAGALHWEQALIDAMGQWSRSVVYAPQRLSIRSPGPCVPLDMLGSLGPFVRRFSLHVHDDAVLRSLAPGGVAVDPDFSQLWIDRQFLREQCVRPWKAEHVRWASWERAGWVSFWVELAEVACAAGVIPEAVLELGRAYRTKKLQEEASGVMGSKIPSQPGRVMQLPALGGQAKKRQENLSRRVGSTMLSPGAGIFQVVPASAWAFPAAPGLPAGPGFEDLQPLAMEEARAAGFAVLRVPPSGLPINQLTDGADWVGWARLALQSPAPVLIPADVDLALESQDAAAVEYVRQTNAISFEQWQRAASKASSPALLPALFAAGLHPLSSLPAEQAHLLLNLPTPTDAAPWLALAIQTRPGLVPSLMTQSTPEQWEEVRAQMIGPLNPWRLFMGQYADLMETDRWNCFCWLKDQGVSAHGVDTTELIEEELKNYSFRLEEQQLALLERLGEVLETVITAGAWVNGARLWKALAERINDESWLKCLSPWLSPLNQLSAEEQGELLYGFWRGLRDFPSDAWVEKVVAWEALGWRWEGKVDAVSEEFNAFVAQRSQWLRAHDRAQDLNQGLPPIAVSRRPAGPRF